MINLSVIVPDKWTKQREIYKKKKKYRAWLVGKPDELGYSQDEEKYSNDWFMAVCFLGAMIYENLPKTERETFTHTSLEWFDDDTVVVYIEGFPTGLIYTDSHKQIKQVVKDGSLEALKKVAIWIEDFKIPQLGTEARDIFNKSVNVYTQMLKDREAKKIQVKQHLDAIKRQL